MIAKNRKKYRELNQRAAEGFLQLLDRVCSGYKMTSLSELEASIIAYGSELLYHRLEADKTLEEALEEVSNKLTPLGNAIVQQFIKEVTKDREICPSQEARDIVVSRFEEAQQVRREP